MGIGGTLTDHHGTLLKAFSKNVGVGLFNETKILAVMEGLKLAKVKGFIQPSSRRRFCNSDMLGK